jgi:hypothetical protein
MTKAELAALIRPEFRDVAVARTAHKPHRCVCADEFRGFEVNSEFPHVTDGVRSVSSTWPDLESAEKHAVWAREQRPEATVSIVPKPNPNYRPDCLGDIPARSLYISYVGEAAFAKSGRAYCRSCGPAWWGAGMRIVDPDAGYPVEAVLRSAIQDGIEHRSPSDCTCAETSPCPEHVEAADCVAAYRWLACYFGIDIKELT